MPNVNVVLAACKNNPHDPDHAFTTRQICLIFVPLVLIMIYLGGWAFNLFISIVLLVAAVEYAQLFGKLGAPPPLLSLLPGICLALGFRWFFDEQHLDLLLLIALLLTAMTALIQYERGVKNAALGFTVTFTGILYLGCREFFHRDQDFAEWLGLILTALPTTWLVDSGAYYLGSWIGKSKWCPGSARIKPGQGLPADGCRRDQRRFAHHAVAPGRFSSHSHTPVAGRCHGRVMVILSPIGDLLISLF